MTTTQRRAEPARFGIRARLLTLLLPAIVVLLALDSWIDQRALGSLVQETYDRAMLASAEALRRGVVTADDGALRLDAPPAVLQAMRDDGHPPRQFVHVALAPEGGTGAAPARTLLGAADLPPPPATDSAAPAGAPRWYEGDYQGQLLRIVALRSRVVDGRGQPFTLRIEVAEDTAPRAEMAASHSRQALLRDARMVLVVVLLVWFGVSGSLRPLERLRRSLLARKAHDLTPLDTQGVPREVAPLVDAVNQHVASYRLLLDEQAQFLADASHQLRTPLAIMLTQAGVALREHDPAPMHQSLRAIVGQIARSRRLCDQLLSLAHASERAPTADADAVVDLHAIAKEVVLQSLALAHETHHDLGWMEDERDATADAAVAPLPVLPVLPVRASAPELHEALANLVHNAIVHTPAGGHVTVRASARDGMARVEVSDDGPGIAAARRAQVFERFHHGGTAAGMAAHGAGLGLAIARAYARRNGGDIELADADGGTPPHGLRAILALPLATDRAA